jgi:thiosulfate dehydrogenase
VTGDATPRPKRAALGAAVATCCAIGALAVGGTLAVERREAAVSASSRATEEYGRRLIARTFELIGPDHHDPSMRYTGNRLACGSCHLGTGTKPGALSLLGAAARYPRFSGRDGGIRDLRDRIDGCMERSMNGRVLPRDGAELDAMIAYINSLGARSEAMSAGDRASKDPPAFKAPNRAVDLAGGKRVYEQRCALCHGADGAGLRASSNPIDGYVFPPLWGGDTYNNGAGMNRVLTAASFIKARMPLGAPTLTDDEAFDVAGYVNAQPRPMMAVAALERDYPDRALKPVDSGYGPYADGFPIEQHRFGPFAPIAAYYKNRKPAPAQ